MLALQPCPLPFPPPPPQVKFVSCIAQSTLGGVLGSQSVCSYRAEGPTTNRRTVLQNCQQNIRTGLGGLIGRDSVAENAIERATDTFIPGELLDMDLRQVQGSLGMMGGCSEIVDCISL
jgi:hypothetical protein